MTRTCQVFSEHAAPGDDVWLTPVPRPAALPAASAHPARAAFLSLAGGVMPANSERVCGADREPARPPPVAERPERRHNSRRRTKRVPQSLSQALGEASATDGSPNIRGFGRREALVLAIAAGHERGIPADWILTRNRRANAALARQLAMAAARRLGYSLPTIGEAFGRDHTTVLHAQRAIAELATHDAEIAAALERIAAAAEPEIAALPPAHAPASDPPPPRPPLPRPRARRTAAEFVGAYRTACGRNRRLMLATADSGRQLVDCAPGDVRVVEQFAAREGMLQIAAVARDYLQRAREERRPLVARRTA